MTPANNKSVCHEISWCAHDPTACWRVRALVLALLIVVIIGTDAAAQPLRSSIGVAFGGGSARGIAHIGVIQWFKEHHIPIDLAAGTSMGGLIGGAFASGLSST